MSETWSVPGRDGAPSIRVQVEAIFMSPVSSCAGALVRAGIGAKFEQVARLARERRAQRLERRETNRTRLAGLQDRQVGEGDVDAARELGEGHSPVVEQAVELDGDRHGQTVPARSRGRRVPSVNESGR